MDYEVRIDNLQGNIDQRIPVEQLIDRITVSLQQMLDQVLVGIPNHDFVRLVINNRHLQTSINLPFVRREHINLATVLQILTNLLNSNEDFLIDGTLEVNLIHVQRMQGGRSKKPWASHGEKIHKSTATVEIKNKDNMCLARAIVVGKAKADKDRKKYDTIRKQFGPKSLQTEEATKLCLAAGVDPKVKCGLKEIDKFQAHLKDYQICVVSKDHMNTFIYKGVKKDKEINLAYGGGHFDTIVSMSGYFQVNMFCHDCKKSRGQTHICSEKCKVCQDTECQIFLLHQERFIVQTVSFTL